MNGDNLEPPPLVRRTDHAHAQWAVYLTGDTIRYAGKEWYIWTGKYWKQEPQERIYNIFYNTVAQGIRQAVSEEYKEDTEGSKAAYAWAMSLQNTSSVNAAITAFKGEVYADPDSFDANPWLLNTQNCILDLETGKPLKHDKKYLMRHIAGTQYNPKATCPNFLSFLESAIPDPEVRRYLQTVFGIALTGTFIRKFWVFYGILGTNGKGTLLRAMAAVLGTYAKEVNADLFIDPKQSNPEAPSPARLGLRGARMVFTGEIPERDNALNTAFVKEITGNDKIKARAPHSREVVEFNAQFCLFFQGNMRPVITEQTEAIYDRLALINFPNTFKGEKFDPNLEKRIHAELPGILNWALEGLRIWQTEGLKEPKCIKEHREDYQTTMDPLAAWLADCAVEDPGLTVEEIPRDKREYYEMLDTLYQSYVRHAESYRVRHHLGKIQFSNKLEAKGYEKRRSRTGMLFVGLKLKASEYQHVEEKRFNSLITDEALGINKTGLDIHTQIVRKS